MYFYLYILIVLVVNIITIVKTACENALNYGLPPRPGGGASTNGADSRFIKQ